MANGMPTHVKVWGSSDCKYFDQHSHQSGHFINSYLPSVAVAMQLHPGWDGGSKVVLLALQALAARIK